MTNGEYVKNNLTAEIVAAVISKLLEHSNDYCDFCPVHEDCNSIHEKISKSVSEEKITCEDIIVHWWNTGIDTLYYSHSKYYQENRPNRSRNGSRACALCGKNAAQVPMARICLDASSGPKKFADLCEECYPKFCDYLGVNESMKFTPNFTIRRLLSKKTKKVDSRTICAFCGTKCPQKHTYCHNCGNELEH